MASLGRLSRVFLSSQARLSFTSRFCHTLIAPAARNITILQINHCNAYHGPKRYSLHFSMTNANCLLPACRRRHLSGAVASMDDVVEAKAHRSELEKCFDYLDNSSYRHGRVDDSLVRRIIGFVGNNETISEQQCVMLIRSSGCLMRSLNANERHDLFKLAWNTLEDKGYQFAIPHYNAALRVRLENNQVDFDPATFLADLETKGLTPNRVTYQLLIASYCEKGDIEGASKILQFMKVQNLPINEAVFNMLIQGHFRKGDVSGALDILERMKSADIEPSVDTYSVLLNYYAECGDMNGINQTISAAERDEVVIRTQELFMIVQSLCSSGNEALVDEVLNIIRGKSFVYIEAGINCFLSLIADGHLDTAVKVCQLLQGVGDKPMRILPKTFLMALIEKEIPFDVVTSYGKQLLNFKEIVSELAKICIKRDKSVEYIMDAFSGMKDEGFDIKGHYFWPILLRQFNDHDVGGLYRTIKYAYNVETDDNKIETVVDGITHLTKCGVDVDTIKERLQEDGIPSDDVNGFLLYHCIKNGEFSSALNLLNDGIKTKSVEKDTIGSYFENGYKASGYDTDGLTNVLTKFDFRNSVVMNTYVLRLICWKYSSQADAVLKSFLAKKISIDEGFKKELAKIAQNGHIEPNFIEELEKTIFSKSNPNATYSRREALNNMNITELETLYKERLKNQTPTGAINMRLLSLYCKKGDVQNVEKVMQRLENDQSKVTFNQYQLRDLVMFYTISKNDTSASLSKLKLLKMQYPSFVNYGGTLLLVANNLCRDGKITESIELLQDYQTRHGDILKEDPAFGGSYRNAGLCKEILSEAAKNGTPELVKKLSETLHGVGYVKELTDVPRFIMESVLKTGDIEQCMECYDYCQSKYNKVAGYDELIGLLVQAEDAKNLQRVVDSVSSRMGEGAALSSLVIAFIDNDKSKQASKILSLQTSLPRKFMEELDYKSQSYIKAGKIKPLNDLASVTKNMSRINRHQILFNLMKGYVQNGSMNEAVEVLTTFDEEGLQCRPHILQYLAKHLQRNNLPVPFEVPQDKAVAGDSDTETATSDFPLINALENSVSLSDRELQILRDLQELGEEESIVLLKRHFESDEISDNFLGECNSKLSQNVIVGFVEKVIEKGNTQHIDRILGSQIRPIQTKALEVLANRSDTSSIASKFSSNGILLGAVSKDFFSALELKDPQQFTFVKDIIISSAIKSRQVGPLIKLALYFSRENNLSELRKVLEACPRVFLTGDIRNLRRIVQNLDNEGILQFIIEYTKSTPEIRRAIPYSQGIYVYSKAGNLTRAMDYFDRAKSEGLNEKKLSKACLSALEQLLQENSQPVPWTDEQRLVDTDVALPKIKGLGQ